MKLKIDTTVFDLFEHITIGMVFGEITGSKNNLYSEIFNMKENALVTISSLDQTNLISHPHIAEWRDTYNKFGVKAKKYNPTHEALIRRLIKNPTWNSINTIVDIYLTNQVEHVLPHGGYDLTKIYGDIKLTLSEGNESFYPIGASEEETTKPGEVIYKDDNRVLTQKWNFRDNDYTKITHETKKFILMIESASENIANSAIETAVNSLISKYNSCFYGEFTGKIFCASSKNNETVLF